MLAHQGTWHMAHEDCLLAYQNKNIEMEIIPNGSDEKPLPLSEMERHGL